MCLVVKKDFIKYLEDWIAKSGICLAHIEQGLPDPTDSTSLHLMCRGIRH